MDYGKITDIRDTYKELKQELSGLDCMIYTGILEIPIRN